MNPGTAVRRRAATRKSTSGMKLITTVNGVEHQLEIASPATAGPSFVFSVDAVESVADVEEVQPGVYSILLGNRSFEVKIEEGQQYYHVAVNGHRYEILVRDPRRLLAQGSGLEQAGSRTLIAPMPGKVVRLMVEVGCQVTAGQSLLVIEAMKMQNEVKSPKTGALLALHVAEGSSVSAGQALAVVE